MPLILAPSFDEQTREQIEQHIAQVQARRMVAAAEYYQGKNAKLEHLADKLARKIQQQYTMLGKELEQLEKIENKVQTRLTNITHMLNEQGLTLDMIVDTGDGQEES